MIRVYPSSKVRHAPMWRRLQQEVPHVFFNARWIKRAESQEEMDSYELAELWRECQQDVKDADLLLIYAEDGDQLKGAFVEVGMALAYGVKVMFVTPVEDWHAFGTWMHGTAVQRASTIEEAMTRLYGMTAKGSRESRDKFIHEMITGITPDKSDCSCGGRRSACNCRS